MSWKLRILIIICQVAQCICGEPNRKETFNIGHGKTFTIVYNIDGISEIWISVNVSANWAKFTKTHYLFFYFILFIYYSFLFKLCVNFTQLLKKY